MKNFIIATLVLILLDILVEVLMGSGLFQGILTCIMNIFIFTHILRFLNERK